MSTQIDGCIWTAPQSYRSHGLQQAPAYGDVVVVRVGVGVVRSTPYGAEYEYLQRICSFYYSMRDNQRELVLTIIDPRPNCDRVIVCPSVTVESLALLVT